MPDVFTSEKPVVKKVKTTQSVSKASNIHPNSSYKNFPVKRNRPLSSFAMCPERVNFETREAEEKVVLFLRQHFIVNVPWIFIGFVMLFVPAIISMTSILELVPMNFKFIFTLIWYLVTSAYILENFLNWFFNVYIITDERIVDVDFNNLIYKEVHDAHIDRIQDVTYNMGGVIRTIFNYGDVLIQTASEVPNFDFLAVPQPDKVAKVLQELQTEEDLEAVEGRIR